MDSELILGSASPRRREILGYFSIPFIQISPDIDESALEWKGDAAKYVETLAESKGEKILASHPNRTIVTADTIVVLDGKVYGKPTDPDDAFQMLSELCGKWHEVYTGVSVRKNSQVFTSTEMTRVLLEKMEPDQIRSYQIRCHSADKAAGYAIQREGCIIVKRIEGCYYNVMGLPVNTLHALLKKAGIDLWDFI